MRKKRGESGKRVNGMLGDSEESWERVRRKYEESGERVGDINNRVGREWGVSKERVGRERGKSGQSGQRVERKWKNVR